MFNLEEFDDEALASIRRERVFEGAQIVQETTRIKKKLNSLHTSHNLLTEVFLRGSRDIEAIDKEIERRKNNER